MTRAVTPRAGAGAPPRPGTGPWAGLLVAAGVLVGIVVSAVTALSWYRHDMRAVESERQSEVAALVDGVRLRLDDIGEFVKGEAASYQGADLPSQTELNDQFALPEVLGPRARRHRRVLRREGRRRRSRRLRRSTAGRSLTDVRRAAVGSSRRVLGRRSRSAELAVVDDRDRRPVGCVAAQALTLVARHRPSLRVANGPAVGRSAQRRRRRADASLAQSSW